MSDTPPPAAPPATPPPTPPSESAPGLLIEERGDGVLRFVLNKPAKRNALDDDMLYTLSNELERAGKDESVRAALITANGEHFCSGFDIVTRNTDRSAAKPRAGSIQRRLPSHAHRLMPLLCTTQLPIVIGARGWVAGIGLHIAAAADFVVFAENARVWEPFSQRGFTADAGGTWLLPRVVGMQRARELLLRGTVIDGATAVSWGLGHSAVPEPDVDAAAEALALELAAGPTVTLGLLKWLLHTSAEQTLEAQMRNEAFGLELSSRSDDFREGLKAFIEKRPPRFTGR